MGDNVMLEGIGQLQGTIESYACDHEAAVAKRAAEQEATIKLARQLEAEQRAEEAEHERVYGKRDFRKRGKPAPQETMQELLSSRARADRVTKKSDVDMWTDLLGDDVAQNTEDWDARSESSSRLDQEHGHTAQTTIIDFMEDLDSNKAHALGGVHSYMNKSVLYLCRTYYCRLETFKYVVGHTHDLKGALNELDEKYVSEWKLEILALRECRNQDTEIMFKYAMMQAGVTLDDGLYDISEIVYREFIKLAVYVNPFYGIDQSSESYLGKQLTSEDHTTSVSDVITENDLP